jgi:hypothetical protein
VHLRIDEPFDEARGDRRIDRVAAVGEHSDSGGDGEIAVRRDCAASAEQPRMKGRAVGGENAVGAPAHGP